MIIVLDTLYVKQNKNINDNNINTCLQNSAKRSLSLIYARSLTTCEVQNQQRKLILISTVSSMTILKTAENRLTLSSVSSTASSLNFSLPPFLRILSQNEASNSALELPETTLLQKTSKASFRAQRRTKKSKLSHTTKKNTYI